MDNEKRKAIAAALMAHTKSERILIFCEATGWSGACGDIDCQSEHFDGGDEVLLAMTEKVVASVREAAECFQKFNGMLGGEIAKPQPLATTLRRARKAAAAASVAAPAGKTLVEVFAQEDGQQAQSATPATSPKPLVVTPPAAAAPPEAVGPKLTAANVSSADTDQRPLDGVLGKADLWPGDSTQATNTPPALALVPPGPSADSDMPDWEKSVRAALTFRGSKTPNEIRKLAIDAAHAAMKAGADKRQVEAVLTAVAKAAMAP